MAVMGEPVPQHDPAHDPARHHAMTAALVQAGVAISTLAPQAGDVAHVSLALGRLPRGLWLPAARDEAGRPTVVTTYPLWRGASKRSQRWQPFPNALWLTCPRLLTAISDMERRGAIAHWQQVLKEDPALQTQVAHDHARYAAMRWAMLTPGDAALAASRGWTSALRDRGVGGLSPGGDHLKCLHAHVAHHLACGNALGGWVLTRMEAQARAH